MARTERKDDGVLRNRAGVSYGEMIRQRRKKKGLSQEELGALVEVGKNAVGAWEAGRSRPDVGSVPVICEALGLSLEEFFGLQDTNASAGINGYPDSEESAELIRRYAALNAYNRQVVMREMSMLYEMQEGMEKEE